MTISRKKSSPSDSTRRVLGVFSSASSTDLQHERLKVPNIIHFIWAGGLVKPPRKYIKSMLMWQDQNPLSQIYFWVDKKTSGEALISTYPELFNSVAQMLNATEREGGKRYNCNPNKIQMMDIEEEAKENSSNDYKISNKFIRYEIDRLKANYGASSDLLRYRIMYKFGGAYFDFDIKPGILILDKEIFDKLYVGNQLWLYPHSQNSSVIGNDVFICTPRNPYMALIYEIAESNYRIGSTLAEKQNILNELKNKSKALGVYFNENSNDYKIANNALNLVSDLYGYDDNQYIFGVTPFKTGPSCVRVAVANIISSNSSYSEELTGISVAELKLDLEELESINSDVSSETDEKTFTQPVSISNDSGVHLLNKEDILPFPQSGLTWVNQQVSQSDIENALNSVVNTIIFEVNELGYMRLVDHINNLAISCNISCDEASKFLTDKLENVTIRYEQVRVAQYTFNNSLIIDFYQRHKINYKDAVFPSFLNNDILYQVPILKILLISKFKSAITNLSQGKGDSILEENHEQSYLNGVEQGLFFLRLAIDHARTAIENKLAGDSQQHIATYLDFLKNQMNVYAGFMDVILEPATNSKDTLDDLKITFNNLNDDLEILLNPIKSLLNQEEDIFDDNIPTNRPT